LISKPKEMTKKIFYKGYKITVTSESHCAIITKDGKDIKWVAGNITNYMTSDVVNKCKLFIDSL
jgi:hypothetical protein